LTSTIVFGFVLSLVYIQQIWRSLVFCDKIWTAGQQPVLCTVRRVCWRAVLLKDKPGGKPTIALKER